MVVVPQEPDPVRQLTARARLTVLVLFVQVAQALMSYDGGATQMSTEALLQEGWSSSMLGLLGAMDKFGQVATAFMWSYWLRRHRTKLLLGIGIFCKSASCFAFGFFSKQWAMLLSKLCMGIFEALIGVWGAVWVQGQAPEDSKARWMGLASLSAGVGNGAGAAVAGLTTRWLGYAFAFELQACLLLLLWIVMMCTPAFWFDFAEARGDATGEGGAVELLETRGACRDASGTLQPGLLHDVALPAREVSPSDSVVSSAPPDAWTCFKRVLFTRLWFWTAISISLTQYVQASVSYIFQTAVCNNWAVTTEWATLAYLLATSPGGGLGVLLGPKLFDGYLKGFARPEGKALCLKWAARVNAATSLLSTASAALFVKVGWDALHYEATNCASDAMFFAIMVCFLLQWLCLNAGLGTLYGINTDSVRPSLQTSAAALTQTMQNIMGFALGPLLPYMAADAAGFAFTRAWPGIDPQAARSAQLAMGMAFALLSAWLLLLACHLSGAAAEQLLCLRTADGNGDAGAALGGA